MKKGSMQMLRKRDMGILFIMALAVYISLDVSKTPHLLLQHKTSLQRM